MHATKAAVEEGIVPGGGVAFLRAQDAIEKTVKELSGDEKIEDMLKAGIIDPTKVTKNALQNAASIAGLMLTTEAMVSEIKEKEKAPAGMPGGGGMGGMY